MKMLNFLASTLALMANSAAVIQPDSPMLPSPSQAEQVWRFQVYVDDKPVGVHEYRLQQQGEHQVISSIADFEYKLMFVTLYNYEHRNQEVWQDGCLTSIDSSTDANGKDYAVTGKTSDLGFMLQGNKGEAVLPGCVMSFAYWNPQFLQASQLLNTQNGDYLEVAVSEPAMEKFLVQGQELLAQRYQLTAKKLELDLWYSEKGAWLGLESVYEGGRTLRYELLSPPTVLQQEFAGL